MTATDRFHAILAQARNDTAENWNTVIQTARALAVSTGDKELEAAVNMAYEEYLWGTGDQYAY